MARVQGWLARLLVAERQQRGETPRKMLYFRLVSNLKSWKETVWLCEIALNFLFASLLQDASANVRNCCNLQSL